MRKILFLLLILSVSAELLANDQRLKKGYKYSKALVTELGKEALAKGNAVNGKKVFMRSACIECHQIDDIPAHIGPDLSHIGSELPIDKIVEELIWPLRNIKEGYELLTITLKDKSVLQGYERDSNDKTKLVIRDMGTRRMIEIDRDQIKSIKQSGSAMPEESVSHLNNRELLDLLKYLSTLRSR